MQYFMLINQELGLILDAAKGVKHPAITALLERIDQARKPQREIRPVGSIVRSVEGVLRVRFDALMSVAPPPGATVMATGTTIVVHWDAARQTPYGAEGFRLVFNVELGGPGSIDVQGMAQWVMWPYGMDRVHLSLVSNVFPPRLPGAGARELMARIPVPRVEDLAPLSTVESAIDEWTHEHKRAPLISDGESAQHENHFRFHDVNTRDRYIAVYETDGEAATIDLFVLRTDEYVATTASEMMDILRGGINEWFERAANVTYRLQDRWYRCLGVDQPWVPVHLRRY